MVRESRSFFKGHFQMSIPWVAITIDVEWAPPAIAEAMLDRLAQASIPATVFCTDHPLLKIPPIHETALHPNLTGMEDWESKLDHLGSLYPGARGLRTHCLHSDTRLVRILPKKGFRYQSNFFAPGQRVAPFRRETGLWEIPIHYMDFFHVCEPKSHAGFTAEALPQDQSLIVLDFHPVLWFLNASTSEDWDRAKQVYKDEEALQKLVRKGPGIATLFDSVIEKARQGAWKPVTLSKVADFLESRPRALWQWPDSTSAETP